MRLARQDAQERQAWCYDCGAWLASWGLNMHLTPGDVTRMDQRPSLSIDATMAPLPERHASGLPAYGPPRRSHGPDGARRRAPQDATQKLPLKPIVIYCRCGRGQRVDISTSVMLQSERETD